MVEYADMNLSTNTYRGAVRRMRTRIGLLAQPVLCAQ